MRDSVKEVIASLAILILIVTVVFTVGYFYNEEKCKQQAESFEGNKFNMFTGCMVKYKDQWLPLANIRGFGDEK